MATKAEKFIPQSITRAAEIVRKMADIQRDAQRLYEEFYQQGGATMAGIGTFDFAAYGITSSEYTDGMAALDAKVNGVGLTDLLSGRKLAALIKLANAGLA